MKIGIIGVGVVGGALMRWIKKNTSHHVACWDPKKDMTGDLRNSDAVFVCIPVHSSTNGQDQSQLEDCVNMAKGFSKNVFIRSTVLPGTNDRLGTTSCPEFLTARIADHEMERLPILVGDCNHDLITEIFPEKKYTMMRNKECELSKFAHNCFGAMKVTYFNMIYKLANDLGINYENVREGTIMSGFINEPHTMVPGPDGKLGYGGSCFPENMEAFGKWLSSKGYDNGRTFELEYDLTSLIEASETLNRKFRPETVA